MLKTTMTKEAAQKSKQRAANNITGSPDRMKSDSQSIAGGAGASGAAGLAPSDRTNPFRFIEAALNEAKSKIEKMKDTPQILESLNDDEK